MAPTLQIPEGMLHKADRVHLNSFTGNLAVQALSARTLFGTWARKWVQSLFVFLPLILALSTAEAQVLCSQVHDDILSPEILRTPKGPIRLTDPEAILLHKDLIELKRIRELPTAERRTALQNFTRQKTPSRLHKAFVFVNYAIALSMGVQIAQHLPTDPASLSALMATIGGSWIAADAISGVYHKFLDSYASESNPLWGSAARSFRLHHEYGANLNSLSYLDNVGAFGKFLFPLYVADSYLGAQLNPHLQASLLTMMLLFSNGTEIHRLAHMPKSETPPSVQWLQKMRIFLSPRDHALHHTKPMETDFGIINGSSNSLTRGFWVGLDRLMWKAFKKMPRNWIQHPESIPPKVLAQMIQDLKDLRMQADQIPEALMVSVSMSPGSAKRPVELDELFLLWFSTRTEQMTEAAE